MTGVSKRSAKYLEESVSQEKNKKRGLKRKSRHRKAIKFDAEKQMSEERLSARQSHSNYRLHDAECILSARAYVASGCNITAQSSPLAVREGFSFNLHAGAW